MSIDKIIKEYNFAHPIQKVWDAISIGEQLSNWFIKTDFEAVEGKKYSFKHEAEGECTTINGEILKVSPLGFLQYTWIVEGTDVETTVSWNLTSTENGTHLRLEHSGISNYPEQNVIEMFNSFSGGWDKCVVDLTEFLSAVNV